MTLRLEQINARTIFFLDVYPVLSSTGRKTDRRYARSLHLKSTNEEREAVTDGK